MLHSEDTTRQEQTGDYKRRLLLTRAREAKYVDPIVGRNHHHVIFIGEHRAVINLARRVADRKACSVGCMSARCLGPKHFDNAATATTEAFGAGRLTTAKDPEEHCLWCPCPRLWLRPYVQRQAVLAQGPSGLRLGSEDRLPCRSSNIRLVGWDWHSLVNCPDLRI